MQDNGYLVSTDTGLSYVVDDAGSLTSLDKSNAASGHPAGSGVSAQPRRSQQIFAAADDAVWSLTTQKLEHSKGKQGMAIVGDKVQVLWFSARQIMLWGEYQRPDGSVNSGLQLHNLDASNRVKLTASINAKDIKEKVPTFIGAEKFIAGGLSKQDIWLWTREGGLLLLRKDPNSKRCCLFEDKAVISFPRFTKVIKDVGLHIQFTVEGDILPPEYVFALAADEDGRVALYTARNPVAD